MTQDDATDSAVGDGNDSAASPVAAELAAEIRRLRTAAGLSQKQLAAQVGYTRQYVSLAERTGGNLPSLELVRALDTRLNAHGHLLVLRERARIGQRARRQAPTAAMTRAPVLESSSSYEADKSTLSRVADESLSSEPAHTLAGLIDILGPEQTLATVAGYTDSIVERYETEGPQLLTPELLRLRRLGQHLGAHVQGESQRRSLTRLSARQAALLSYTHVNLGRFREAAHFSLEASLLATSLDDTVVLSWVKGTQSFAAYYRGRYREALTLAETGLRIAGSGPQRIRLLSNGIARAAGKLGDRLTVDRALGEALDLAADLDIPGVMTSCVSFESYKWARTAANAATAYLAAGEYGKVLDLTSRLRPIVADSDSDWSRSLVSLDEATALTLSDGADLDYAASVGLNALELSAAKPIASIATRATELAQNIQQRGKARHSLVLLDAVRDWRKSRAESVS